MDRKVSKPRNEREKVVPASQSKRRKTDHTLSRRTLSAAAVEKDCVSASTKSVNVSVAGGSEFRIQQAKNFAVRQAQQEGCTGNFKILDSPFGNFLLPIIPSPAELAE